MNASGVGYSKSYILNSPLQNYQAIEPTKANFDMRLTFTNSQSNQLGQPLPFGNIRVYQKDGDGDLQLVGEDQMASLANGEVAQLSVGKTFDLMAEHQQMAFRRLAERVIEITTEVTLWNRKSEAVFVTLNEKLFGDWQVTQESLKGQKTDGVTQTYQVQLQAQSSTKIVYTARITY